MLIISLNVSSVRLASSSHRATPATLSPSLADLADYAAVILVNVNARDLSPRKMDALRDYVRDLGGGLAAVGGPQSFGVGGYFGTPLEEALPVNMQIDDQERFPAVSIQRGMNQLIGAVGIAIGSSRRDRGPSARRRSRTPTTCR